MRDYLVTNERPKIELLLYGSAAEVVLVLSQVQPGFPYAANPTDARAYGGLGGLFRRRARAGAIGVGALAGVAVRRRQGAGGVGLGGSGRFFYVSVFLVGCVPMRLRPARAFSSDTAASAEPEPCPLLALRCWVCCCVWSARVSSGLRSFRLSFRSPTQGGAPPPAAQFRNKSSRAGATSAGDGRRKVSIPLARRKASGDGLPTGGGLLGPDTRKDTRRYLSIRRSRSPTHVDPGAPAHLAVDDGLDRLRQLRGTGSPSRSVPDASAAGRCPGVSRCGCWLVCWSSRRSGARRAG